MEEKIDFDDLEFGESQLFYLGASYNGLPFTGTAYLDDVDEFTERSYVGGLGHGRWFTVYKKSGQLAAEEWYENGVPQGESREWDDFGRLIEHTTYDQGVIIFQKKWNGDQILIRHIDTINGINKEYYADGSLYQRLSPSKLDSRSQQIEWFLDSGEWLGTNLGFDPNEKRYRYIFDNTVFLKNAERLTSQWHHPLYRWFVSHLIQTNREQAFDFLSNLSQSQDGWLRGESAEFLGKLEDLRAIPILEKLLSDHSSPSVQDRNGWRRITHTLTIGQRAQKSLNHLRKIQNSP